MNKIDSFRGVEYSKSVANFFTPENLKPEADWHPRIPGIVYWGKDTTYRPHVSMYLPVQEWTGCALGTVRC